MTRRWINQCIDDHKHQRLEAIPGSTILPARILHIVNNASQVVLQTPSDIDLEYTALSHCWGSLQPATLTSNTLERFKSGVDTAELPQTFKDAILLSHTLGIHYLWIDSLCIVQDDPEDWRKESSKMHYVYNNSTITIAASRAADSSKGFLGKRLERTYVPVPFRADEIYGQVLAYIIPEETVATVHVYMEDQPLSTRSWALQERCMSRRTLHFTDSQIFFECEQGFASEDCYYRVPHLAKFCLGGHLKEPTREQWHDKWCEVVTRYSRRKLALVDDKLVALAGLAAYFSSCYPRDAPSILNNRYIAGLWLDDLVRYLCWAPDWSSPSGLRPQKYRAPTWPWASLDGAIEYGYISRMGSPFSELTVVQDAQLDLEYPGNLFGEIVGGWISLGVTKVQPYLAPLGPYTDPVGGFNFTFQIGAVGFFLRPHWDSASHPYP